MDNFAVIDLGTNTFHLLIARREKKGWMLLFRERLFIKLAEEGIEHIGDRAFERGVQAMVRFKERLSKYPDVHAIALGTAALREADNANQFLEAVKEQSGIQVEVITGAREASLIYRGVRQLIPFGDQPYLIMDIGGGSVEWIVADSQRVLWAQSFPLGAAVLRKQFHRHEPISPDEINALRDHLDLTTKSFQIALKRFSPIRLVGASGTFDVLARMIMDNEDIPDASILSRKDVRIIIERILPLDLTQRENTPLLPISRADLIVVALLLIEFVLEKSEIDEILYSSYAMKEGVLQEMLEDLG